MTAKPYPWYYTVNDRPVMIEQLPDGGVDCLVFDVATGDFVVDREYLSYTLPGSGKDVEQLTEDEFARVVSSRCADVLQRWAERLCRSHGGSAAELIETLGLDRQLVQRGTVMELEPPPLGADKVMVSGGALGLAHVDVRLPEGALTRAHLDARFGAGRTLPRVGAHHPQVIAYDVTVAGAPGRCTVFGHFRRGTNDAAPASAVVLRTEPAR